MLALYRTLSLRYLRKRLGLNVLVMLSIGLGVSVWVATSALYQSLEESFLASLNPMAGAADLIVTNGDAGVPRALEPRLASVTGVQSVRPLVIEGVRVVLDDGSRHPAVLFGVEVPRGEQSAPSLPDIKVGEIDLAAAAMAKVSGKPPAVVGRGLQALLPAGSRRLRVYAAGEAHELTRVGTIDAAGPLAALGGNVVLLDCDDAARLLDRPGRVSRLDLVLTPGADRAAVERAVRAELKDGEEGRVGTPEAEDNRFREMLQPVKVASLIVSAGALVVGMFLVYNTLSVCVTERRHDVGVMRSVGATRPQVSLLFLGEALLLGVLGVAAGIPFGLGLARLLLGPIGGLILESLGTVPMRLPALTDLGPALLTAAAGGVLTSLAAALVPALGAAREEPADAVRRVPARSALAARAAQLAACLLLAAVGTALVVGHHLLPSPRAGTFLGIGCIFVAVFLAIALSAAACARLLRPLAQRVFPVEGRLAADNLVRAPGRTGLVIAALAACVALLAHTAGITRSNEAGVMAWLDRAITADLIVTSGGPVSATGQTMPMKEEVGRAIERLLPGSRTLPLSWRNCEWRGEGRETWVSVAAVDAGAYYELNRERQFDVPNLPLFRRLADERGTTVVSENFAALNQVAVGDRITVQAVGGPLTLRVIGAVEDCSSPRGLIYVDRTHYAREFDTGTVDFIDVYLPPGADAEAVERARDVLAQSSLAAEHALVPLTGTEVRESIMRTIRRIYSIAYLQELAIGAVAALGVVAALVISVLQRRRELGLLRAVGATRGQVLRTVLFEALLMGLIGGALGAVFGLLLEWYGLAVILAEESGYRLPLVVPWREAALIVALAVAAATLAGLLPALRAVRLRIADAIAYE